MRDAKIGLYDIVTSTTLESNKSLTTLALRLSPLHRDACGKEWRRSSASLGRGKAVHHGPMKYRAYFKSFDAGFQTCKNKDLPTTKMHDKSRENERQQEYFQPFPAFSPDDMLSFSPLVSGRWPHPGPRAHSGARACGAHPV